MRRPGKLLVPDAHSLPSRAVAFLRRLGGFPAADRSEASDISEREMRRIRAKQIDAVTRLVPLTMTINLVNVAIILFIFWNTGSNIFLGIWALAITSAAALAIRSWARVRRAPPNEVSRRATRRMTIQSFGIS